MSNLLATTLLCLGVVSLHAVEASESSPGYSPNDSLPALVTAQDEAKTDSQRSKTFAVDAGHSSVLFRVTHLKAGPFWGRFNAVSGTFRIDDANLADSFVKVTIPVDSVDTNSAGRDKHLKNTDFFNAKEYPTMTFESTKIERKGEGTYHVHGKMTMRGTTKDIVAKVTHVGTAEMSKRFGLRSGYEADFTIDRTDFGVSYMAESGGLGKDVRVILGIEGKLPK